MCSAAHTDVFIEASASYCCFIDFVGYIKPGSRLRHTGRGRPDDRQPYGLTRD